MYRVDMSQRPDNILRGLINFDNETEFTSDDIKFNPHGATALPHREKVKRDRNSRIMTKFVGKYSGEKQFFYNRIDLNAFFGNITAGAPFGTHKNTVELLPYVRKDLGIDIADDEILFEYINPEANYWDIIILSSSITYLGTVRVFFKGSPGSLPDQVRNTTLVGFTKDNIEVN